MKNIKIFITAWLFLFTLLIASSSLAQTDNYSCNVICLNEPNHIMTDVKVDLFDSENSLIATTFTDEQGYFYFEELLIGESYTAKFEYSAENTYVDLEDAFAVLSYVFGYLDFDDVQLVAADVNGDNNVDFNDFWAMLYNYYILQQPFPVGDWVLPDWEFTLDNNKATGGPAGTISTGNVEIDDEADKSSYFVQTNYNDIQAIDNLNEFCVPVYLNYSADISGFALVANFDNEIFDVVKIESPIEDLNFNVSENEIRMGWTFTNSFNSKSEQAIAKIYLKQKQYTEVEQIEKINILNESHILDPKGNKIPYLEFSSSEFKTAAKQLSESSVYPNPCTDYFNIQLEESIESAEYLLYNSLGQLMDQKILSNGDYFEISTSGLQKGIYYYHINYQSKSITGPISIR